MDLELSGRVGIVTGASRGIGLAIAQTLSAEGMSLLLVARSADRLDSLAVSLPSPSLVCAVDLRDQDVAETVISRAIGRFGRLDLLVNNAGAAVRGDFLTLSDEDWSDGFALKFFGGMRLSRASWPHLKESSGSIVNIVGIGGRTASAEFTIGGAVNSAILNLTKALADRGVADGVRVNAINPGSVATERLQTRVQALAQERGITSAEAETELARHMKVARFGQPAEIAAAVAFLASDRAAYCQGTILDIDGGATRTL